MIGGLTTGFTTWLGQRSQARAGMVAHDLVCREDLIRDFIIAASKTYGDAIINSEPKMPEIVDLYAMVNRRKHLESDDFGSQKAREIQLYCSAGSTLGLIDRFRADGRS